MIARYRTFLARLAQLYPDPVELFRAKVLVYTSAITTVLVTSVLAASIPGQSQ